MLRIFSLVCLVLGLTINSKSKNSKMPNVHSYEFRTLDGKMVKLSSYKGKKILIVNTASQCGYTPQYKQLEELYQTYKEKLVIVGFPTNDFGGQEPGTNADIKTFCQKNYGVTFPMSEKITVEGKDVPELYKYLTQKSKNGKIDSKVEWNFQKYLIDEDGNLIEVFKSAIKPDDKKITAYLK